MTTRRTTTSAERRALGMRAISTWVGAEAADDLDALVVVEEERAGRGALRRVLERALAEARAKLDRSRR